jgi:hypothetical protein
MAAWPMRRNAPLIRSSALAGCLRHSQEMDSGTQNHTTGIIAAVAPAPSSKTTRQLCVFNSGERISAARIFPIG